MLCVFGLWCRLHSVLSPIPTMESNSIYYWMAEHTTLHIGLILNLNSNLSLIITIKGGDNYKFSPICPVFTCCSNIWELKNVWLKLNTDYFALLTNCPSSIAMTSKSCVAFSTSFNSWHRTASASVLKIG